MRCPAKMEFFRRFSSFCGSVENFYPQPRSLRQQQPPPSSSGALVTSKSFEGRLYRKNRGLHQFFKRKYTAASSLPEVTFESQEQSQGSLRASDLGEEERECNDLRGFEANGLGIFMQCRTLSKKCWHARKIAKLYSKIHSCTRPNFQFKKQDFVGMGRVKTRPEI